MDTKQKKNNTTTDSYASDPGQCRLSHIKLRRFHPDLYGWRSWLADVEAKGYKDKKRSEYLKAHAVDHLLNGDSRAAIVLSVNPLLIAAYTEDIDCVTVLHFPSILMKEYNLKVGTHLLSVNKYDRKVATDLKPGPKADGIWGNYQPFIAEFLSNDRTRIEDRKAEISDAEWQRAWELGQEYLKEHPRVARSGLPFQALFPAKPINTNNNKMPKYVLTKKGRLMLALIGPAFVLYFAVFFAVVDFWGYRGIEVMHIILAAYAFWKIWNVKRKSEI